MDFELASESIQNSIILENFIKYFFPFITLLILVYLNIKLDIIEKNVKKLVKFEEEKQKNKSSDGNIWTFLDLLFKFYNLHSNRVRTSSHLFLSLGKMAFVLAKIWIIFIDTRNQEMWFNDGASREKQQGRALVSWLCVKCFLLFERTRKEV